MPSEFQDDVSYVVDMMSRSCSCPQGRLFGPCKHKLFVSANRNEPCFDVIPTSCPKMRQLFKYIGTGKIKPIDWFLPLQAEPSSQHADVPLIETKRIEPAIPDQSEDSVDITGEQVDPEAVKQKVEYVLKRLRDKLLARIDQDPAGYNKALDVFGKTVDKLPATIDSALPKSLCAFGKTVTQVIQVYYQFT